MCCCLFRGLLSCLSITLFLCLCVNSVVMQDSLGVACVPGVWAILLLCFLGLVVVYAVMCGFVGLIVFAGGLLGCLI